MELQNDKLILSPTSNDGDHDGSRSASTESDILQKRVEIKKKLKSKRAIAKPGSGNSTPTLIELNGRKGPIKDDYQIPLGTPMPPFKPGDLEAIPRPPMFLHTTTHAHVYCPGSKKEVELYLTDDHPFNRRGYRYIPCEASEEFDSLKYRPTEVPPFGPRVSFEDMSPLVMVDRDTATIVSTEKGYRTARANVGVREGKWFWECRILRANSIDAGQQEAGNVRVGWTRREASLETPVGFDAYGYGIRDVTGQKMYISRGSDFMKEPFKTGDVIGLYISLPPVTVQLEQATSPSTKIRPKKIQKRATAVSNVVRDRFPIRYKGQMYFEQYERVPIKRFQDMLNQTSNDDIIAREKTLREEGLANSSIRIYKNGKYVGTPFESLLPFLPPNSVPLSTYDVRTTDDGNLGYYPSISVYRGASAQFNFGPDFDYFPADLRHEAQSSDPSKAVRGMYERYDEQIAEDIVWDVVDEVTLQQ
ncbi:uncharacterized protein V1516DRAFT_673732 [Lipomyces oligophaga]|uniref:uncharacterized protein n=1 Tax=Lipomyces oligophaga TaxID=45792 RepID=UPI0034CFB062